MSKYTRIVKNMADQDYRNEVGVSQSSLKPFFISPMHYKHELNAVREVTSAMLMGTATHIACFQPAEFDKMVVISQKFDRRKTEDKIASAKFNEENAGKIIIDQEQHGLCLDMAESVRSHPFFYEYCQHGDAEVSAFADMLPYENVRLKGRMDFVNWERKVVIDLKTTNLNLTEMYKVKNLFKDDMFYMQAAMYIYLLKKNGFSGFTFFFILVEKEPPHGVKVFQISDNYIIREIKNIELAVAQMEHCIQHDAWTSYDTNPVVLDI